MRTISDKNHYLDSKPVCPYCAALLDGATGIGDPETVDEPPDPGSLTVCIACAAILLYDEDLKLRKPRSGELAAIGKEDPEAHATILLAQRTIRQMHRDNRQ